MPFFSAQLIWKFANTGETDATQGLHLLAMERAKGEAEATQGLRLLVMQGAEAGLTGIALNPWLHYCLVIECCSCAMHSCLCLLRIK